MLTPELIKRANSAGLVLVSHYDGFILHDRPDIDLTTNADWTSMLVLALRDGNFQRDLFIAIHGSTESAELDLVDEIETQLAVRSPPVRTEAEREYEDWTDAHWETSAREGWSVWDCNGSKYGRWQICKFDSSDLLDDGTEIPCLDNDDDAMRIVRTGTGPHHAAARAFIEKFNPAEWAAMNKLVD